MRTLCIVLSILIMAVSAQANQFSRNDPRRGSVTQPANLVAAGNHVLLRIIKEDRVLELWKLGGHGWTMSAVYPICNYSGRLGPKLREGDLQAPEGFYSVTSHSLNPFSVEHLSFNLGFPNARDRASGRTGSFLMVHGGCSSRGCFAMTDAHIEEIYAAVRDALLGGQDAVQVQIYPFRMTDQRMQQERSNPNHAFWTELKAGWDLFEEEQRPLEVTVHRGRYVVR